MVRWRSALVLAILILLPHVSGADDQDDDSANSEEDNDNSEEEEDDRDDDSSPDKVELSMAGHRAPVSALAMTTLATRTTTKKRPLECYVCSYKMDTQLMSCLNPLQYNVKTMTCHHADEKCFTSVISQDSIIEAVVRGCRTACVVAPDTTCCQTNRCNNQEFPSPVVPKAKLRDTSKATKSIPHSILFFVTILLLLQTVVKVTIL